VLRNEKKKKKKKRGELNNRGKYLISSI